MVDIWINFQMEKESDRKLYEKVKKIKSHKHIINFLLDNNLVDKIEYNQMISQGG